jgi:hypothetical protein
MILQPLISYTFGTLAQYSGQFLERTYKALRAYDPRIDLFFQS